MDRTCVWSRSPPGNSVQQVSDTEEVEHDAAPVVEQPELILLNKLTESAGVKPMRGEARVEPTRAPRITAASIFRG